ncbi:MAG: GNAT family N-acetyltransferase [Nocardioides sp.]|nr:GNAT family N-acetyltransferase [Nocardioides sp.]
MPLDAARVREACAAWTWFPDDAAPLQTDDWLLVKFPEYAEHELSVVRFHPTGSTADALASVLAQARRTRLPELLFWVRLGAEPDLDERLLALGGRPEETLDVLALDLAAGVPDTGRVDAAVELVWIDDVETLRAAHEVFVAVFGGEVPPPARLEVEALQTSIDRRAGLGGALVALLDGEPVGAAGLTVADDGTSRLWSGAVLPHARGRGVYRALLGARLAYGAEQGSPLALVKGRVESSGPILRRCGFTAYGEERSYLLPLGPARA